MQKKCPYCGSDDIILESKDVMVDYTEEEPITADIYRCRRCRMSFNSERDKNGK